MPARHSDIRIGISGWTYAPWRGVFFPKKLPHKRELEFASTTLPTIEINGTFYSLQRPSSFAKWYQETPETFVFSVKGPRFITHMRRLKDAQTPLANFLLSGVLRLNEKLGPFLWQLPPNFAFDAERLETFFDLLPRTTKAAATMKRFCGPMMKGRSWDEVDVDRPMRHAIEIRHESFRTEAFAKLLRKHDIALVCADTPEWPRLHDVTSDFVYVRLHGHESLYASGYSDVALDEWAAKIRAWSEGRDAPGERIGPAAAKRTSRDVFVYFDNDVKVRAPFDAATLARKLGLRDVGLDPHGPADLSIEPRQHWPGIPKPTTTRRKKVAAKARK